MAIQLCTDADLIRLRPKMLSYNILSWASDEVIDGVVVKINLIDSAKEHIGRIIDIRWYRDAAKAKWLDPFTTDDKFDIERVKPSQLNLAAVYKTLELAYQYLMNDAPEPDAFERNSAFFAKEFEKEMNMVLADGIIYDWDDDDDLDDESIIPIARRLRRG